MSQTIGRMCVASALCGMLAGCGMIETTKRATAESMRQLRPRPNDYRDTSSEAKDEWTSMGEVARSYRPSQKEDDPLRNVLLSPKARSIERNLGVD